MKPVLLVEGKAKTQSFDKSYYSEGHDVPALWIGQQIVALGNGFLSYPGGKDDTHLLWRLDPSKTYRVTIEEVPNEC